MKIAYDGKRAVQNNTGLGNYSRYVVEILAKYFPENEYHLFAPKRKDNVRLQTLRQLPNVFFHYPKGLLHRWFSSIWRVWNVRADVQELAPSLFHGLSGEIPFGIKSADNKIVVTIHDLIFLRYPGYYKPWDRWIYTQKFRYACHKADKIIAISECTKRDIIRYFGIDSQKIEVVYQGCHPNFSDAVSADKRKEVQARYRLPERFLLYVGTIEPRKNLKLIVQAMKYLPADVKLVAVGKCTPYQAEVEALMAQHNLQKRIQLLNNVPFDDLPALYAMADIFVYPSYFEGFGIPIIEALSAGTPVIAATGSCLEEAGGEHSVYVNPDDAEQLAAEIDRLWSNSHLTQTMREKGKIYVQRFSDEAIARQLMHVYNNLINS